MKAYSNTDDWVALRKSPRLYSLLRARGETWVSRLNAELHRAQQQRGQPVEDGYAFHIQEGGDRLRLHIVPFTARAQAHEARNQSILKLMDVSNVNTAEGVPEELARRSNEAQAARRADA